MSEHDTPGAAVPGGTPRDLLDGPIGWRDLAAAAVIAAAAALLLLVCCGGWPR